MKYAGIAFDLDGTLVGTTLEHRIHLVNGALELMGRPNSRSEDIEALWFRHGRHEFVRDTFEVDPHEFWRHFIALDTPEFRRKHTKVYDDVEVLREFGDRGLPISLVTGAPRATAELNLALVEEVIGKGYIGKLIVANSWEGIRAKPHPQGLYDCLSHLRLPAHQVPYVGNGPEDVTAAKAAGMHAVMIDRGEHAFEEIARPDRRISSLYELRDIVYATEEAS